MTERDLDTNQEVVLIERRLAELEEEKQRLIAEILNIPYQDFEHISDMAGHHESSQSVRDSPESPDSREAKEVLLAALAQGKNSTDNGV